MKEDMFEHVEEAVTMMMRRRKISADEAINLYESLRDGKMSTDYKHNHKPISVEQRTITKAHFIRANSEAEDELKGL